MPDADLIAPDGGPVSYFRRKGSTACQVLRVRTQTGKVVIINREDFDEAVHTPVADGATSTPSTPRRPPPSGDSDDAGNDDAPPVPPPSSKYVRDELMKMTIPALCALPEAAAVEDPQNLKKDALVDEIMAAS